MKTLKFILYGVVAMVGIQAIYLLKKKPELKKQLSEGTTEEGMERIVSEVIDFNKSMFSDVFAGAKSGVEVPVNAVKEFVGDKTQKINQFWDEIEEKIQDMKVLNESDAKNIAKDFVDMKNKTASILKRLVDLKKS